MQSVDGNQAAVYVSYAMSDVSFIFPITPSSPMAENADVWASQGRKNVFGQVPEVFEMESEAGAAGAVHGGCAAGSLVSTYTCSQGLMLMIPNMIKIAGEHLPCVFHVSARALAGQALSIFGDHSDVMACRSTGFCLLSSHTVQQAHDLGIVAHLAAMEASLPFLHFFDGFRTSHEIQKIHQLSYDQIKSLVVPEYVDRAHKRGLNPIHPTQRGTSQGPDVFFQAVEKSNADYDKIPEIVQKYMDKVAALTGRKHKIFEYYGAADAERVVIAMGAGVPVLEETVDYLATKGEKVGVLAVHLYRPFSAKHFLEQLPASAKKIAVLDRVKEIGSFGEPLYLDVATVLLDAQKMLTIVGGRYGLGSKEFTPVMAKAVFDNLKLEKPKNHFTVGIDDDVTHLSLPLGEGFNPIPAGTTQCMFWGLGSDGTVGANHDAIRIIGQNTEKFVQAYFYYDAHKSGGITVSHLRFGDKEIKSQYLIQNSDYTACHFPNYVQKYDMVETAKEGSVFVLNCPWTGAELEKQLPGSMKRALAKKNIKFYVIDAIKIGQEVKLGRRINMIMQTVFFKLADILPFETAVKLLKEAVVKTYGKKGPEIVKMNHDAIDRAVDGLVEVKIPAEWATAPLEAKVHLDAPEFVNDVLIPQLTMHGNELPVSKFAEDGFMPMGTTKYEKRGIATAIPAWESAKCVQCNMCSLYCPHAAIRPFLLNDAETKNAPASYTLVNGKKPVDAYKFRIQVSSMDCTGCGVCVTACPAKCLAMTPFDKIGAEEAKNWEYSMKVTEKTEVADRANMKGAMFRQPLLEFSGACEGCNETALVKLITQLSGERAVIANATGCSSIWGATWGTNPYTVNAEGRGPAWGNSLFEDNAEYGFGMYKATQQRRAYLEQIVKEAIAEGKLSAELKTLLEQWVEKKECDVESEKLYQQIKPLLAAEKDKSAVLKLVEENSDVFIKVVQWIVGGDGWAYDIGYNGVDHVLASGQNVNILVLDTEMYSNTGGQKSKATNLGAIAKFAAGGNRRPKKDLGAIAMSYGDVYVASVALGANPAQAFKAFKEAESYNGVSIIIAYCPCKEQGVPLNKSIEEQKMAVNSGYWSLYRYDPRLVQEGKAGLQLDCKEIKQDLEEFLNRENRFALLGRTNKKVADELHAQLKKNIDEKLARLTAASKL
ncbi:pyruvate-flavodoxin oxidoreductase, putative [Entamoeba invadens IP1]|uniref:pyruvate dehydrogenase (NADP(+)) n=1 Tax=Entamoeba invadens IP1 TaxID=370355 RepID=A0A0A1UF84_ENTIV|nr:pyruvate-flavodoxin oxidoreductase, putative [Entamoeba invadens IP1]ELP92609.1 pyruvate-flavodoxin oxidoreductase, putative [Entamoeba invadens IP1]|eukprot:XP_004259380.1 pyruvate-flavodoxin oxidoreductase, putative [Entamoeba invadens IP1]